MIASSFRCANVPFSRNLGCRDEKKLFFQDFRDQNPGTLMVPQMALCASHRRYSLNILPSGVFSGARNSGRGFELVWCPILPLVVAPKGNISFVAFNDF